VGVTRQVRLMGDGVTGALDGPLEGLVFSLSDWGWVVRDGCQTD
jgi:hypothetical protein